MHCESCIAKVKVQEPVINVVRNSEFQVDSVSEDARN